MRWLGAGVGIKSDEQKGEDAQQRAQRLAAFAAGKPVPEVWALDLAPLLITRFDAAVHAVVDAAKAGDTHAVYAAACQMAAVSDLFGAIDQAGNVAAGTAQRMAQEILRRQAVVDAAKERTATR